MFNASCQNPDQTHMVGAVRLSLFFELFFDFPIDQGNRRGERFGSDQVASPLTEACVRYAHARSRCAPAGSGHAPRARQAIDGANLYSRFRGAYDANLPFSPCPRQAQ